MATIKQLDDQISKLNVQKDAQTIKANQIDQKMANLRKTLAASGNNPKQADLINKQLIQLQTKKAVITGIDFDVNETKEVVEEDGESISTGAFAGAAFPMPLGVNPSVYTSKMNPKKSKKQEAVSVPLLRRAQTEKVNSYIDNLGGK